MMKKLCFAMVAMVIMTIQAPAAPIPVQTGVEYQTIITEVRSVYGEKFKLSKCYRTCDRIYNTHTVGWANCRNRCYQDALNTPYAEGFDYGCKGDKRCRYKLKTNRNRNRYWDE